MNIKKSILIHYCKTHRRFLIGVLIWLISALFVITMSVLNNVKCSLLIAVVSVISIVVTVFKFLLNNTMSHIKIYGGIVSQEQYMAKYPELFGDYLTISGVSFSEDSFKYPFFIWSSIEEIYQLIGEVRQKKIPTLVFIEDDDLFKKLSKPEDLVLDFKSEEGYGWDFCKDFRVNPNIIKALQDETFIDSTEYFESFKRCTINDSSDFLKILCLIPSELIETSIKSIVRVYTEDFKEIRSSLFNKFSFLSQIQTKEKNISILDNDKILWIRNASLKLSRFILDTSPENTFCIVNQSHSHDIKRGKTAVFNSSLNDFYIRFDGSYLYLNSTDDQVAKLFGNTSVTNIKFAGEVYNNLNMPAISTMNLSNRFFRYYTKHEICNITK